MGDNLGVGKEKLWLDAEFRRYYPLTAQTLKEAALQEQVDLGYRRYTEVLRSLRSAAELTRKELTELSAKEGGLEFIGECKTNEDNYPRPSPQEALRSFQEVGEQQDLESSAKSRP
jgi:hypothetical protein